MAENKTVPTKLSVKDFIAGVKNETRRKDAQVLLKIMREVTGKRAKMWGNSLVGFDKYHYKYDSGREGDSLMVGFSPRAQNMAIYIMPGFEPFEKIMAKLGKYKTGASCLYINKLADVDIKVLTRLITQSYKLMQKRYPS
ncbi:MAG: DUF1801 domain-containing protein [Pseudomonadota bacterium]